MYFVHKTSCIFWLDTTKRVNIKWNNNCLENRVKNGHSLFFPLYLIQIIIIFQFHIVIITSFRFTGGQKYFNYHYFGVKSKYDCNFFFHTQRDNRWTYRFCLYVHLNTGLTTQEHWISIESYEMINSYIYFRDFYITPFNFNNFLVTKL